MKTIRMPMTVIAALLLLVLVGLALPQRSYAAIVDTKDEIYTHSNLSKDISDLSKAYPKIFHFTDFGRSLDDRKLYCLYLGNQDAEKQIFVTADMHAREYLNGQVVMKCIEYYCENYETGSYDGVAYKDLFDKVCIVILPMINPDGVSIAMGGAEKIRDKDLREALEKMDADIGSWQANARGVDLNRNWGIWKEGVGSSKYSKEPAYEYFGGASIYSEPETRAVRRAINTCSNIQAFINFHSMGRLIYWGYADESQKNACQDLAEAVRDLNGYTMKDESSSYYNHGDFEHYLIKNYQIPYVCIETGLSIPVPTSEFQSIYKGHRDLFAMAAKMYQ